MTLEEAIKTYTSNAEYERTHGSLLGCLDFRQLVDWLKDYKRLREQETQPCEQQPCDDAISRAEAIRVASGYCHWTNIPAELEKLPSVTPEQKMGRWIPKSQYCAECSACGCVHSTNGADLTGKALVHKALFKYCPNCGAKMEGVEEPAVWDENGELTEYGERERDRILFEEEEGDQG